MSSYVSSSKTIVNYVYAYTKLLKKYNGKIDSQDTKQKFFISEIKTIESLTCPYCHEWKELLKSKGNIFSQNVKITFETFDPNNPNHALVNTTPCVSVIYSSTESKEYNFSNQLSQTLELFIPPNAECRKKITNEYHNIYNLLQDNQLVYDGLEKQKLNATNTYYTK